MKTAVEDTEEIGNKYGKHKRLVQLLHSTIQNLFIKKMVFKFYYKKKHDIIANQAAQCVFMSDTFNYLELNAHVIQPVIDPNRVDQNQSR